MVPFFNIFSCRRSFLLVFRLFSLVVALSVVTVLVCLLGERELRVFLLDHLGHTLEESIRSPFTGGERLEAGLQEGMSQAAPSLQPCMCLHRAAQDDIYIDEHD